LTPKEKRYGKDESGAEKGLIDDKAGKDCSEDPFGSDTVKAVVAAIDQGEVAANSKSIALELFQVIMNSCSEE